MPVDGIRLSIFSFVTFEGTCPFMNFNSLIPSFSKASVNSRKDKSLRVMSQKFVMLFLVSTPQIVSLEIAAKILIGEDHVEDG